jgi:hypothetical protein
MRERAREWARAEEARREPPSPTAEEAQAIRRAAGLE